LIGNSAYAQSGRKHKKDLPMTDNTHAVNSDSATFDRYHQVYRWALKYNDPGIAASALYNMMALRPEETFWKDTLAILYFNSGQYIQATTLGNEIVQSDPQNNQMLEILAISEQSLGLLKEPLAHYEQLYRNTQMLYYLYQVATLQYNLKRFGECSLTLEKIIADEKSGQEEISIAYGEKNSQQQKVPMKAAAYNLQGVMYLEMNQPDSALESFDKALEIFPDFKLAQSNKEMVEKAKEESGAGD